MAILDLSEDLQELLEDILEDLPKSVNGNKSAAQRIRTKTVRLAKLSKEWRKNSLDLEKKRLSRSKAKSKKK